MNKSIKKPTLLAALIPIVFLVIALFINVLIFGDDGLSGSNQLILVLASAVAAVVAMSLGMGWTQMQTGIVKSISSAMPSMLILLLIGSLAGTWLLSGIVPALIYYGLQILNAKIFLFASCIVCAIISVASGSSWSTIATIGVALLGIGTALGIHEGLIVGSIISGAYFGDKMSPLSDTTNLAPAVAGTDLFTHIRYMVYTTVPSISIALIIYLVLGFVGSETNTPSDIDSILSSIDQVFNINLALFIVPAIVIGMIIKKVPAVPALLSGILLGALFAIIFQPQVIEQIALSVADEFTTRGIIINKETISLNNYIVVMKSMFGDIEITTSNAIVNELLATGGMKGMLGTIWLIICAMVFGGIMEASGMLHKITETIINYAHSTGSLIASTATTCLFFNVTASDQYLAIVVPGKMFAGTYKDRGLKPENLSRALEDSGTVTSVLVPWNTCGATQSNVLGVATFMYFPYCFFNIISPIMTILFGYFQIKLSKYSEGELKQMELEKKSN